MQYLSYGKSTVYAVNPDRNQSIQLILACRSEDSDVVTGETGMEDFSVLSFSLYFSFQEDH